MERKDAVAVREISTEEDVDISSRGGPQDFRTIGTIQLVERMSRIRGLDARELSTITSA